MWTKFTFIISSHPKRQTTGWHPAGPSPSHEVMSTLPLPRATARLWEDRWRSSQRSGYTWMWSAGSTRESVLVGGHPSDALGRCVTCRDMLWRATWFPDPVSSSSWDQPQSFGRISALRERALAAVTGPKGTLLKETWPQLNDTIGFFSLSLFIPFLHEIKQNGGGMSFRIFCQLNGFCKMTSRPGNPGVEGSSVCELCHCSMLGWVFLHDKGKNWFEP